MNSLEQLANLQCWEHFFSHTPQPMHAAAFSSTMVMLLMPDSAMLTYWLFIAKRSAISAEDYTLPGSSS